MTAVSHSSISIFFNLVVLSFFNFSIDAAHLIAMITFAWIPDIDSPRSVLGRICPPLSSRISLFYGHRGLLHSMTLLGGFIVLSCVVFFLRAPHIAIFFLILYVAFFTHIISDCFTKSGVRLLYPSPNIYVFPKSDEFRFHTGNMKIEAVIIAFFIIASGVYFFTVSKADGFIPFLRSSFGMLKMAEDQFTSFEGYKYRSDIEYYDKIARQKNIVTNAETLYADKAKVVFIEGGQIKHVFDGDHYTLKRVSLRRTDEKYDQTIVTNTIENIIAVSNIVAFSGTIDADIEYHSVAVTRENAKLKCFYISASELPSLKLALDEHNKKKVNEAEALFLGTPTAKVEQMRRSLHILRMERAKYLFLMDKASVHDQMRYSETIKKLDQRIETMQIDLSITDVSQDAVVLQKVADLKRMIYSNALCVGVIIR